MSKLTLKQAQWMTVQNFVAMMVPVGPKRGPSHASTVGYEAAGPSFTYDMYVDYCRKQKSAFARRPVIRSVFGRDVANIVHWQRGYFYLVTERKRYSPGSEEFYGAMDRIVRGGGPYNWTEYTIRTRKRWQIPSWRE